jgi:hypothetical protein
MPATRQTRCRQATEKPVADITRRSREVDGVGGGAEGESAPLHFPVLPGPYYSLNTGCVSVYCT